MTEIQLYRSLRHLAFTVTDPIVQVTKTSHFYYDGDSVVQVT
jgi:hypothetical protein